MSFAYCMILPIVLTIITFKINNPEAEKNSAMHHSGGFVIVPWAVLQGVNAL